MGDTGRRMRVLATKNNDQINVPKPAANLVLPITWKMITYGGINKVKGRIAVMRLTNKHDLGRLVVVIVEADKRTLFCHTDLQGNILAIARHFRLTDWSPCVTRQHRLVAERCRPA